MKNHKCIIVITIVTSGVVDGNVDVWRNAVPSKIFEGE